MLYILYSKQQQSQGKKLIAGRFKDAFGIDAIKKFTNKSKVDEKKKIDDNLIYLGTNENEQSIENRKSWAQDDFIAQINKRGNTKYTADDIYMYSRPIDNGQGFWWYGIIKDEVMRYATTSNESRLLVCTDIEIIQKIASVDGDVEKFIKQNHQEFPDLARHIMAYCLIRKKKIDSRTGTYNDILIKILKDGSIESDEKNKIFQGLSDGTLKLLDRNGIIDNAFFNNIVLFNNLLIIKDVGDMDNPENVTDYNKTADQVIEKYVGIFPRYKKIFVVHPMGNDKGGIPEDEQRIFRKFVQCIFYDEIKNGREILFAEDVQNQNTPSSSTDRSHSDFELTSKILESIDNSSRVVCDLRYVRTNCLYEYGYAKGLCEKEHIKDVCLLYQEGDAEALSSVFDVRNANAFYYPNIMELKNLTYEEFYKKVEMAQRKFHLISIPQDRRYEIFGQFQSATVKNIKI